MNTQEIKQAEELINEGPTVENVDKPIQAFFPDKENDGRPADVSA